MQLEVWLLCVEAWSELCVSAFPALSLQDLQTTAMKWCRVERDKLQKLCTEMKSNHDSVIDLSTNTRYECLGRLLQDISFEKETNDHGTPT